MGLVIAMSFVIIFIVRNHKSYWTRLVSAFKTLKVGFVDRTVVLLTRQTEDGARMLVYGLHKVTCAG